MKHICPICGSKMKYERYYEECFGYILSEEYENCHKCKYRYEFEYGASRMFINGIEFGWTYGVEGSKQYNKQRHEMIKQAWSVQKRLRRLGKLNGRYRIRL